MTILSLLQKRNQGSILPSTHGQMLVSSSYSIEISPKKIIINKIQLISLICSHTHFDVPPPLHYLSLLNFTEH